MTNKSYNSQILEVLYLVSMFDSRALMKKSIFRKNPDPIIMTKFCEKLKK